MKIDFWFDPACPWCWLTSRWVETVVPKRDLEITWRSISLFFKNNPDPDHRLYEPTLWSRNLLRVVEAVREAGHEDRVRPPGRGLARARQACARARRDRFGPA